jgi:hypothetical protein
LQNTPSYDESDATLQALNKLMDDTRFQRILVEIGALPEDEQLQAIFTRLAPQALVAEGLEVPEGYSITTSVSWHPADTNTRTANFATKERNAEDRNVSRIVAQACAHDPSGKKKCIPVPMPRDPSDS